MSSKYKGIIFDLDGTLIKSTIDFVKMKQKMIKILEAEGIPKGILTPQITTVTILETSEKIWDENNKSETSRVKIRNQLDKVMDQGEIEAISLVEEIDDTTSAIRRLHKMHYRLAILTRSHHEYAVEALKKLKIDQYFEPILGRGQTPRPKPYKESLEHTAMLMDIPMDELVFIGDHHIDYQTSINSGCNFIGVDTRSKRRDPWEGDPPEILLKNVGALPDHLAKEKLTKTN